MNLKFHHVNLVSKNVDELNNFYQNILGLKSLSQDNFKRTKSSGSEGYEGAIKFVSDGNVQMHLAEKDLGVASKNKQFLNPVEKGHIAFRTENTSTQLEIQQILLKHGYQVTEVKDRNYFKSIYFREPGGVLFEIATDEPGFAIDEEEAHLGELLKLPDWAEPSRDRIEKSLAPVSLNPSKYD